jgi:uncharacterized protein
MIAAEAIQGGSAMDAAVVATDDPRQVLEQAHEFLVSDPVRHNVMLTILADRALSRQPGRYWIGLLDGAPAGLAFQSPLTFAAGVSPMPAELVAVMVDAIATAGVRLPGVIGEAATAALFAGQWTERCKSAAVPLQGQRIYEVTELRPPAGVDGAMGRAAAADRELLIEWLAGFHSDTGHAGPDRDQAEVADRWLAGGQVWFWRDGFPASVSVLSASAAGVSRIQAVYTPPGLRGRGYAAACVAELSGRVLAEGRRCILYTDLGNPTSNSVYRRIGYRAVAEVLRYRLG